MVMAVYSVLLRNQLINLSRNSGTILETTKDGFWLLDMSGRILMANDAYAKMAGYEKDELAGKLITDFEANETPEETARHIQELIQKGHLIFESRHRHRSGRFFNVEVSCTHDPQSNHVIAFFRDISEQKTIENAVKELSQLNRMIIENSESGIMVHEATGQCILANKAAARIVGTDLATLMKHNFRQSRSWLESGELAGAERALSTGETQIHDVRMHTIYGKDIWCLGTLSRLILNDKPYLLTIFTDIMEIRNAEETARAEMIRAEAMLHRAVSAEEKIVSTSEEVQRRFGQELHDGLGQKLTGAALLCRALADRLNDLQLAESRNAALLVAQLNDAIQESREIARGLLPIDFQTHGLIDSLQKLADKVPDLSGKTCIFDWDSAPEVREEVAFNLYRIAQEAVNNALKHSRGNEIVISLKNHLSGDVTLHISDNGMPDDEGDQDGQLHEGIGLKLMEMRASVIKATLAFNSDRNGTEVIVRLPAG